MKKYWKSGLIVLFLLLASLGIFIISSVIRVQAYGRLINFTGIVRGASQRLIKLELSGKEQDELILYLDDIMENLRTGEGQYGLPLIEDTAYQEKLSRLGDRWTEIKQVIDRTRKDPENHDSLLEASEEYFTLANETVFAAEDFARQRTRSLLCEIGILYSGMLFAWLIIFNSYGKKVFHLEGEKKNLEDLTSRDPLTGLYNMERFLKEAQKLIDSHPDRKYAVIYMDFADFKYVNDIFGYEFGDEILRRYGKLNLGTLGLNETVCRIEADSFGILRTYEDKDSLLNIQKAVDREISKFCKQPLSVNCGICCVEDVVEKLDMAELLNRANYARKIVKTGLKRNYAFYDEGIRKKLRKEKEIEGRMEKALEEKEFIVYYQPKVDLETGKAAEAEALVRWASADGIIAPDLFIPVFEQKFLISRLDQYVFRSVCEWLRKRLDAGKKVVPVSVNVSRLQFYDPEFISIYVGIREQYHIPHNLLEIEFTESIAFENEELLKRTLVKLREHGFSIAVDDFGKGYSSFSLLKEAPVDVLKIDRLFFMEGEDRHKDNLIVESIIKMAHDLGMHTVAEGIEMDKQVRFLRETGCDLIQGYVFYKPLAQAEFEQVLDSL